MISHPVSLILFLLTIEISILYLAQHPRAQKYFDFLPSVFWIYFLPMLASTFGWIDSQAPVYKIITTHLLPASLFLLLMTVDIKAIVKLGKDALAMMAIGSLGICVGTVVVFAIFKNWVGLDFYAGFGALSASWTGGSANMIAVKEAVNIPDHIFAPMVIVDTIVPYVWMGMMVSVVGIQTAFDRWNHSNQTILQELSWRAQQISKYKIEWKMEKVLAILVIAAGGSLAAQGLAQFLPVIQNVISISAWTIIVVTTLGILCSFTPIRTLEKSGSNKIGYFFLYFVLTTIGAKASLANMSAAVLLISAGFCIVLIHAVFLLIGAKLLKAPLFLVATASQANVGGVASAPVVAEIYQPGLASVGLLLAICGNIFGTYIGILTVKLCEWVR